MPTSTPGMVTLFVAYWLAIQHIALCEVPTNTELSVARVMGPPNINIGESNQLRIKADFPAGATDNVTIEIIVSSEDTVLAFVKVLSSSVGSNLRLDLGKAALLDNPVLHPGQEYFNAVKVQYNTRAVIDLGTVTNSGSDTNLAASQISITYEVVMVTNAGLGAGVEYWTSVEMEFHSGKYVRICHISYTLSNAIKSPFLTYLNPLWFPPYKENIRRTMNKEVEIMQ